MSSSARLYPDLPRMPGKDKNMPHPDPFRIDPLKRRSTRGFGLKKSKSRSELTLDLDEAVQGSSPPLVPPRARRFASQSSLLHNLDSQGARSSSPTTSTSSEFVFTRAQSLNEMENYQRRRAKRQKDVPEEPPEGDPPPYSEIAPSVSSEQPAEVVKKGPPIAHGSLEEISALLLKELKDKPGKEKALQTALKISEKVATLESEICASQQSSMRSKELLLDELEALDKKRSKIQSKVDAIDEELQKVKVHKNAAIDALKSQKGYRTSEEIDKLMKDINQLNVHSSQMKQHLLGHSQQGDLDQFLCLNCSQFPEHHIYGCPACDGVICSVCKSRLKSCPGCNKTFSKHSPKRNRLAEKLLFSKPSNNIHNTNIESVSTPVL